MKKIMYRILSLAIMAVTLTSCEDVPAPYGWPFDNGGGTEEPEIVYPKEGDGTEASPYNVAALKALIESADFDATATVWVRGTVSQVVEDFSTQYGNITYYISDDGTQTNQMYIYRGYGANGAKFKAQDDLKVGDRVLLCGTPMIYNSAPQLAQGSKVMELNGEKYGQGSGQQTEGGTGDGTKENPYNSIAANNYVSTLAAGVESEQEIYIKGKIVSIKDDFNTTYGNASFYISDDGKDAGKFYVFRTLYLGNVKYTEGQEKPVAGDEVVICGKVVNYMGNTPETVAGKSYLYSWTKGEGGSTEEPAADGIVIKAADLQSTNATSVGTVTVQGITFTCDKGSNTNDPKYYSAGSGTIRVYPTNTITLDAGSKKIASIQIDCDSYSGVNYTAEGKVTCTPGTAKLDGLVYTFSGINSSKAVITNTETGTGGATQMRIIKMTITLAE